MLFKGRTALPQDLVKASGLLIDDFRSGKLGRMTLERIDSDNE